MRDVCLSAWHRNDGFAWFAQRKGALLALKAPSALRAVGRTSRLAQLQAATQGFDEDRLEG